MVSGHNDTDRQASIQGVAAQYLQGPINNEGLRFAINIDAIQVHSLSVTHCLLTPMFAGIVSHLCDVSACSQSLTINHQSLRSNRNLFVKHFQNISKNNAFQ
jgi:hypothetical protein